MRLHGGRAPDGVGQTTTASRVARRGAAVALSLVLGMGSTVLAAPPAPSAARPAEWSDSSYYLKMKDGVGLAVSLWFPGGRVPKQKLPVVLIQTRYGRAGVFKYGEGGQYQALRDKGYVIAVVDTRGSTSSFGDRRAELAPEEVRDMDLLIAHLKSRPWSNGQVIATGVSYMADTADLATGSPARVTGAVVRESDFDGYLNLFAPGGVANDFMMSQWGGETLLRDYGKSLDPKAPLDCRLRAQDCPGLWPRLQPVDADPQFHQLRAALDRRRHWKPDDYRLAEFRDDKGANGYTMLSSSPAAYLPQIARQAAPVQYWASWMDAGTAEGVLSRYRSLPHVPMEVWITANNHGGEHFSDPFFSGEADRPLPTFTAQWDSITAFMARLRAGQPVARQIHYYVLGARTYRTSPVWPPAGVARTTFRFGPGGSLARDGAGPGGEDRYAVDFTATTGAATRWTTQIGEPAAYGDRREPDRKLLTYTSEPFAEDMELAGTPSVRLFVASTTKDPAFFAYLEDVAPDGRVTYLTEGLFRAVNRRPAGQAGLPYVQSSPAKTYARDDAEPMVPGRVAEVEFPTFPVAALLKAGHRLRLSLAGADASAFRRYSEGRDETWQVARTAAQPSSLSVDLRPWGAP